MSTTERVARAMWESLRSFTPVVPLTLSFDQLSQVNQDHLTHMAAAAIVELTSPASPSAQGETPGDVSDGPATTAPSPGDTTPTAELLFVSASVIDTLSWLIRGRAQVFPGLTAELRARAHQLDAAHRVAHEDLAAHVFASWHATGGSWSDVARELLAEFHITKK
ncbi:hypothetical protein [Mycolicibacterium mageritense]|uniref:hypothetical protein n=1 Tax=Mycolicibacterium mageritense TaxID=53462 RepID=UPI001E377D48|nr:hypothetical protein [Mycolicibacterium mageritense]MCC9182599.1 hypothetical protein [Mycolicibacterium mageritense]